MKKTSPPKPHPGSEAWPRALVVMGVAASGKSTVGRALALELGWRFVDGDDLHAPAARARMEAGTPLGDAERAVWLEALGLQLEAHRTQGIVLACSALKVRYRDHLRAHVPGLRFVWLDVSPDLASRRGVGRQEHFFPAGLIPSQFEALESPAHEPGVLPVDAALEVREIVTAVERWLGGTG